MSGSMMIYLVRRRGRYISTEVPWKDHTSTDQQSSGARQTARVHPKQKTCTGLHDQPGRGSHVT